MLFLVFLVDLNECKTIGVVSKKSATTTTTPFQSLINLKPSDVNHCEGDDCPDIADAFIQLQSEMKTQLEEKERQAEINSNLAAENDEKNAAIFQLESIKQKQMALITNLQDKDDNANKKITAALNANLTIQLANLKAELAKEYCYCSTASYAVRMKQ